MDPYTQTHVRAHTESPLPGHFALERAEKLMRLQSFITLETERERGNERKRERDGERERERVIQCPPFAVVAMGTPISP